MRPVKLNMVVLRGRNDHEVSDLVRFAMEHGCQVRFLELMPIGVAEAGFEDLFVPSAEVRERLSREFTLTPLPVDPRSTSRNYVARDRRGLTDHGRLHLAFERAVLRRLPAAAAHRRGHVNRLSGAPRRNPDRPAAARP